MSYQRYKHPFPSHPPPIPTGSTGPAGFGAAGNLPSLLTGVKQHHFDPVLFKLLLTNEAPRDDLNAQHQSWTLITEQTGMQVSTRG